MASGDAPINVPPRPPPLFVGDHLAMDLLNSRAHPNGVAVEWLADGADLVRWLGAAGLDVPAGVGGRELDRIAGQVRGLRESFRGFVGRHAGRPLKPTAVGELAEVNAILSGDAGYRQLGPGGPRAGSPLVWVARRRPATAAMAVLLPLADAIGDLVVTADFTLVRQCEGHACTLSFLDRTKSHARRWCSMAACGNRAKAAAHRARQRGGWREG